MHDVTPKEFEKLVANLQRKFAGGSSVKQNAKIVGRITGRSREVDVAVTTSVAGESLLIAVECRRRARKCDVSEVEAFASKLADIFAHKGIIVSAKGFTVAAGRLAKAKGISLYRYEDTLKEGWPSGFETTVKIAIWEIYPIGGVIVRSDGSRCDILSEDEHQFRDSTSGDDVGMGTLMRKYWEKIPEKDKCNGDQYWEHPISTPEDSSVTALALAFKTFRHQSLRLGRLQFEGFVDDESKIAKVKGWKMVFPEEDAIACLQDRSTVESSLSLQICSTLVHTANSSTKARLQQLLHGHFEITVGVGTVYEIPFTS